MPNVAFGKAHKKRRGRPRTGHREAAAGHNAPAHMPLEVLATMHRLCQARLRSRTRPISKGAGRLLKAVQNA